MVIYFILRRFSGVSKQHKILGQHFREADKIARDLQDKTGTKL